MSYTRNDPRSNKTSPTSARRIDVEPKGKTFYIRVEPGHVAKKGNILPAWGKSGIDAFLAGASSAADLGVHVEHDLTKPPVGANSDLQRLARDQVEALTQVMHVDVDGLTVIKGDLVSGNRMKVVRPRKHFFGPKEIPAAIKADKGELNISEDAVRDWVRIVGTGGGKTSLLRALQKRADDLESQIDPVVDD